MRTAELMSPKRKGNPLSPGVVSITAIAGQLRLFGLGRRIRGPSVPRSNRTILPVKPLWPASAQASSGSPDGVAYTTVPDRGVIGRLPPN